MKMVSELVFTLTLVLCVILIVITVGERKNLRILFICIGTSVH
jgi:hypothetical protein